MSEASRRRSVGGGRGLREQGFVSVLDFIFISSGILVRRWVCIGE